MCGGRGTRLDSDVEKPLFEISSRPMVDYVRDALAESRVDATYAVVSPNAPETHAHLQGEIPVIETAGEGYVADLTTALDAVETPVLTVAADLPLLDGEVVNTVLDAADGSTSVRVPAALKDALGASTDEEGEWVPTGVNVVADDEDSVFRSYDARLAVNVNHRSDAALAERLLAPRTDASKPGGNVEGDDGP
ncbi:NTP transferase domain-containing protein [Halobacterium sp. KA-6]|jgi:adenosylcobinamide-phosphate guanylyltransferase|uniref:NTP transferase domain-containing protein n=1 Tax=Halobacterium sp. KA-6 TaxID=2896368 RepID=UPI001E58F9D1|nr:NTP transferase domain-containing protein [Halobacterium sp. KA-6]MCD2204287.1 NTP transferase domain-containing protein [Halobacterium sp. KA-6]